MPSHPVNLSPTARTRAEFAGEAGLRWLLDLPDLVAEIEERWSITIGEPLPDANEGYVARAKRSDGTAAVVKLLVPMGWYNDQIGTLERAEGRGYVKVLETDHDRRVYLMESLGEPLGDSGRPVAEMLDLLVATLRQAWTVPPPRAGVAAEVDPAPAFMTGTGKAQGLRGLIEGHWEKLSRPCSAEAVDLALRYLVRREAAFDPDRTVWAHGDPHAGNALAVPGARIGAETGAETKAETEYVFIDPEGLLIEPAYDLGVILRDWDYELATARDPFVMAQGFCSRLAESAGVDRQAVWEWGFIERVATGLYVLDHGIAWGRDKLANAERLLAVD